MDAALRPTVAFPRGAPQLCCAMHAGSACAQVVRRGLIARAGARVARGGLCARGRAVAARRPGREEKSFPAGTRTPVVRVKAGYPDQLDYREGLNAEGGRTAGYVARPWPLRRWHELPFLVTMRTHFRLPLAVALCVGARAWSDEAPHDTCAAALALGSDATLHVFALSDEATLWHKRKAVADGWSRWAAVPGGPRLAGSVAAVRTTDGRLRVFARGVDRAIYYTSQTSASADAAWSGWTCFGGQFAAGPTAVVNAQGFAELYAVGRDGAMYSMAHRLHGEALKWSEWEGLSGNFTGPPSALLDAAGMVHVFARGLDRAVWHKEQRASLPCSVTSLCAAGTSSTVSRHVATPSSPPAPRARALAAPRPPTPTPLRRAGPRVQRAVVVVDVARRRSRERRARAPAAHAERADAGETPPRPPAPPPFFYTPLASPPLLQPPSATAPPPTGLRSVRR